MMILDTLDLLTVCAVQDHAINRLPLVALYDQSCLCSREWGEGQPSLSFIFYSELKNQGNANSQTFAGKELPANVLAVV